MALVIDGNSDVSLVELSGLPRIVADFSSGTPAERAAFQTSTLNGNTNIHVIPNGTSTSTGINLESDSAVLNGVFLSIDNIGGSDVRFSSATRGTGTAVPMTFYTGGSESVRITTNGNVGVGTSAPSVKFQTGSTTDTGTNKIRVTTSGTGTPAFSLVRAGQEEWLMQTVAGSLAFNNGTERMCIDPSGNVGIGTSSPGGKLDIAGSTANIQVASSGVDLRFTRNDANYITASNAAGFLIFRTGGDTERARIDSSGNLLVGATSPAQTLSTNNVLTLKAPTVGAVWGVGPTNSYGTFYITTGGTGVSLASGGTSWGTVSDERQKDIIEPITDSVNKVLSLRSVIGKYKTDNEGVRRSFLIAQDVQAVLPEAVDVGEDENQTLAIKYTEVIPLLVSAIQELKAELDAAKERIASLEAK